MSSAFSTLFYSCSMRYACDLFVNSRSLTIARSLSLDKSNLTFNFTPLNVIVPHGRSFSDGDACLKLSPTRFSDHSVRLSCSRKSGYPPYRTAASSLHHLFPSFASFPNSIKIQYYQRYDLLSLDSVDSLGREYKGQ